MGRNDTKAGALRQVGVSFALFGHGRLVPYPVLNVHSSPSVVCCGFPLLYNGQENCSQGKEGWRRKEE